MTLLQPFRGLPRKLCETGALLALSALIAWPSTAATILVIGDCKLEDAIRAANLDTSIGDCTAGSGADTIVITHDVVLLDELPEIDEDTVIDGAGFTVSRDPLAPTDFPVFSNDSGFHVVEYRNITVTGGNGTFAGGIDNRSQMVLIDSTVSGNVGHGIFTYSTLTIERSTIADNTNGVSSSYALVDIVDSTISGNAEIGIEVGEYSEVALINTTVSGNDMGIAEGSFVFYPYVDITHATITGNRIGLEISPQYAGAVNIEGSIFGKNLEANCGGFAYFSIGTGNLADDRTCGPGFIRLNGLSGNLADWGGPTLTHGLKAHSSAIDASGDCGLVTDQRGYVRDPGACDSGAHERGAQPPTVSDK